MRFHQERTKGMCKQSFCPVEKHRMSSGKLSLQNGQCPKHHSVKMKKSQDAPHLILG